MKRRKCVSKRFATRPYHEKHLRMHLVSVGDSPTPS
jgi:hypothetical protein